MSSHMQYPSESAHEPQPKAGQHAKRIVHRRSSRTGIRSVATLSTAQRERKRATDQGTQRAIRQRTKDYIDRL